MDFNEIFTKYQPKQGFKILKGIGSETGRYIAFIYKEVEIIPRKREVAEISLASIATHDIKEFLNFLLTYIETKPTNEQGTRALN